ncbi:MAG: hypothetical protein JWM68_2008 [Verrucomicrobiales bacterium]|nr:hypothetical protein [Verrucomicrobiales bacterium]
MNTKTQTYLKSSALICSALALASTAHASTDYGPAIWNPPCNANYYTTGSGHKFHVVHDIEGYYLTTISMFKGCGYTAASVHYLVNGKQDASSDAPAGEITQMLRDSTYGWHARCWNTHSTGTEHEGFANNPAWYTDALYQASAGLTRNLGNKFGWAKDRNHIIAHGQKSVAGWPAYASANLGIDPNCNTHTDPGPYWDWTKYMGMVNGSTPPPPPAYIPGDFTGNGRTDYTLFRPSTATWYIRDSAGVGTVTSYQFGQTGDIPLIGNWTSQTAAEFALFRPSTATWYVRFLSGTVTSFPFGASGDIPLIGGWSGRMRDQALFRPSTGMWYVRFGDTGDVVSFSWGINGDVPFVANFGGKGMIDQTMFRPSTGTWFVRYGDTGTTTSFGPWGGTGDIPLIGAWSGRMQDATVFRPSNGTWYIRNGSTGTTTSFVFGQNGDVPSVGNIFGNGVIDQIVFRPSTGTWYVRDGNTGTVNSFVFGQNGDIVAHE